MAMTKYTYSVSGDFPNQKVNSNQLTQEIEASAIATVLDCININEDVCDIWFVDALSGGDQTILNGIVAAHQGTETSGATQTVTRWAQSTTTDNDYQVKATLNSQPLRKGMYQITWNAEMRLLVGGMSCLVEVVLTVDNQPVAEQNWGLQHWMHFGGTFAFSFNEADEPVIVLKFRVIGTGGDTACIRRGHISLIQEQEG